MFKMSIKPQWQLEARPATGAMPHLLKLLLKIHETHTLAKAALPSWAFPTATPGACCRTATAHSACPW